MTIVAGDILRTSVNFLLDDGTLYQNVYHHRRSGIGIIADAVHVTALSDWATAMYAELDDKVSAGIVSTLSTVALIEWTGLEWEIVENIGTFTIAFTATEAATVALPNQLSPFVTFKTTRPRTVGRKFLFPFTETHMLSGVIAAGSLPAIVAYADDAVNNVDVVVPLDLLVPGVHRVGVDEFLDFTVAIVTDLTGTQRRRRRGVGA